MNIQEKEIGVRKQLEITQKITGIVFINFSKKFGEYIRMENPSYKIAQNDPKIS